MLPTILLIVLVLLLLGALPRWPHSTEWGYGPSGLLGIAIVLLVVFAVLDHTPVGPVNPPAPVATP